MFILDPGTWFWIFSHPGSEIKGTKKHRIPDPGSGSATLSFRIKSSRYFVEEKG
jgi:hypothetical protein